MHSCCNFFFTAVALLAMTTSSLLAADNRDRFEACRMIGPDCDFIDYQMLTPKDYDPSKKYPLVLFLHGAGERGNDNKKQLIHGMDEFASDEVMAKYPAFVIAPQCPTDEKWVEVDWGADSHKMPNEPSRPLRWAKLIVTQSAKDLSIDKDRIYVTGLSMGGYGTWDAIQRWPDMFAAAAPICGGGDPAGAKAMAGIPIWAFHGSADTAVKPQRSRDMIAAIKAAGGSPKYTEYPGVGHNSWSQTYSNPEFYAWLFAQKRGEK
jgi:predicted peptidase